MNLGAHMSIQGGLHKALERGLKIGCQVVQLFTQNQMRWQSSPLDTKSLPLFHKLSRRFFSVFAHSSYLINLGSPDNHLFEKSLTKLTDEIFRCHSLDLKQIVIHSGFHCGSGMSSGIKRVAQGVRSVLEATKNLPVMILIETTAGQGSAIGHRFEHLCDILYHSDSPNGRIGICIDTCHLFAAGYDFSSSVSYTKLMDEFNRLIGLQWLKAVHLNDSKGERGSRIDRHEHIGRGRIGLKAFKLFLTDPRLSTIPLCIETPKGTTLEQDVQNLEVLRELARNL